MLDLRTKTGVLTGGAGDDYLEGEAGEDQVVGDAGQDELALRDGARCGDGLDEAEADGVDELAADCESVDRAPTPAPPPQNPTRPVLPGPSAAGPVPVDVRAPALTARATAQRLRVVRRRGLAIDVRCDERCTAGVRVRLTARDARRVGLRPRNGRPVEIGHATRTLDAGRTATVPRCSAMRATTAMAMMISVAVGRRGALVLL